MYESELNCAKNAVIQAGEMLVKQKKVVVDSMEGKDIKLAMDKASENVIINCLTSTNIPILSEEQGFLNGSQENLKKGRLWIIDPIDGSVNYWKGIFELSCVSVALWEDGKPVLGVINRFYCNELFIGIVGEGAWLNGKPIITSVVNQLSEAVLATGFPLKRSYNSTSLEGFIKQIQHFKKIRMLGAAAIMGAFVACGRVDAYMEESIMLWDIAAAASIVLAAGGVAEIEMQDEFKCICKFFSNKFLMEDFYKKCV